MVLQARGKTGGAVWVESLEEAREAREARGVKEVKEVKEVGEVKEVKGVPWRRYGVRVTRYSER